MDFALVRTLLARGLGFTYRELSGSMRPCLQPYDQVHVQACAAEHLRRGDIVALHVPAGLRVHRLIAVRRRGDELWLHTAGDALRHADPPRPASELLGRVVRCTRGGKQRDPLSGWQGVRGRWTAWARWTRWRAAEAVRALLR